VPAKPRITPWNGFYRCDGDGVSGFGITGPSAYWQWLAMARPRPQVPSLTPEQVAMLETLRAWVPTHAHS